MGPLVERLSFRAFWVRRICRLYPLYWLSIAAVVFASGAGLLHSRAFFTAPTPTLILVNLSMLQPLQTDWRLQEVYWTLGLELIFYVLASLLASLRQFTPVRVVIATVLGVFAMLVWGGGSWYQSALYLALLATIWVGAAMARAERNGRGFRGAAGVAVLGVCCLGLIGLLGDPIAHAEAGAAVLAYALAGLIWDGQCVHRDV